MKLQHQLLSLLQALPLYLPASMQSNTTGSASSAARRVLFGLSASSSPLYGKDLSVTLGVVPKRVHSHNDVRYYAMQTTAY